MSQHTHNKRYFFFPQYQVYHRDKSTEYADIRKQLIPSSVFPLKEKLKEVTVAQTQISHWDLNTETIVSKINRCHVEHIFPNINSLKLHI